MTKLKLREDLPSNFTLTKQLPGVGMMKFDSSKVNEEDYHKWSKIGFADLFVEKIVDAVIDVIVETTSEIVEHFIEKHTERKNKKFNDRLADKQAELKANKPK